MKFCNIYPVANQQFYKKESMVMILAHLVVKGLYNKDNFTNNQYVIMDNGLFEKAQVSTSLQDCIDIAEKSGIPVNEIIVPDAANDTLKTIILFEQNLPTIRKYKDKYHFMFVAQCKDEKQLLDAITYINNYKDELPNLTVGISKLSPMNRDSDVAIDIYKKCLYPIHFLGLKSSLLELIKVKDIIRSCDSSQLAYIVKNKKEESRNVDINTFTRSFVQDDIDLAVDVLDNELIEILLKKETI